MLRRNLNSDFVGGAYVFPGGAVDPADRETEAVEPLCSGRTDAEASELLTVPSGGLAYWVAAVRECFEEAGVLLAYDRDGSVLSLADPATASRFEEHRAGVYAGTTRLVDLCAAEGLTLAADRIHYFSHWITPVGPPRRYDTRFFVAQAPPEQVPLEDKRETIASLWVNPAEALARQERGELEMIFPTIRNLEAIARFNTTADLLAAAAAIESVPAILPRVVADGQGVRIVLPGDPLYDQLGEDAGLPEGMPMPGQPGGPALPTSASVPAEPPDRHRPT